MRNRNPITLEALEILDSIDRRGSFAKAAEELGKATSALSYGVQKLEEELGVSIYVRQGRRSVLTPAGRLVLEEGRTILAATEHLADRTRQLATGWESRLRIGLESIADQRVFFKVLEAFQAEHPQIEFDVNETLLNGGWEALEQQRIDLLIGGPGPVPVHKGIRVISMGTSDLVPVIGAKHPDAKKLSKAKQRDFDFSSLLTIVARDSSTTTVTRSAGLSLSSHRTLFVQSMEQKTHAILAGLGIGQLPRYRVNQYLSDAQLIELSLEPDNVECFVAWEGSNKGKALGVLSRAFASAKW